MSQTTGSARRRRVCPPAIVAVSLAALIAACASLPPKQPARVAKAPDTYQTAQSFTATATDWPADGWWKAYGDAQLDTLMDEGFAGSPTLAQASERVRKAQSEAAAASASELPTLSLNASAEEQKQSYHLGIPPQFVPHGYQDYGRVTLDMNWELDFWGKNRAAIAAATSEAKAAAAEASEARLTLSTAIASAYADLLRLFAERQVAAQAVDLREQTAALVRARVANGLDTQAELRQAEAGPPAARADLAAIDETIARDRNAIAALLGAGPDRGLAIAAPATPTLKPFGLPERLAANLIGRRPDVVAARWRAEAATHRVKQAKAAFYPDVNLVALIGATALHLNALTAAGSDIGSIGPALSLPIFEGGRLRAGLRGAEADRDAAVAAYDATLTEALHEVADAAASERALTTRLAESRTALAANEDAYRIARLRYEGGLANYQSVLLAEIAVLDERRIVADLEARAFALDVELVRALGGGFSST
jgi:NodT family efflux transporter outer membrane factor (OMF) lipoprotein